MWKKIVALALGIFMMVTPVMADEFGMGGAYVSGHSEDKDYAVNNDGYGVAAHFDKDMGWQKRFSENNAVGIDPGMAYFYLRWEKDTDKTRTKKSSYNGCRDPKFECEPFYPNGDWNTLTYTEKYSETEWVNSHFLGVTLKPYWEIYKDFRLFGHAGPGYEFADDNDGDAFAVLTGFGAQYMWTENFGTSLSHNKIWSDPFGDNHGRRFDATVFSFDVRF